MNLKNEAQSLKEISNSEMLYDFAIFLQRRLAFSLIYIKIFNDKIILAPYIQLWKQMSPPKICMK
jgi:hypothetical protein